MFIFLVFTKKIITSNGIGTKMVICLFKDSLKTVPKASKKRIPKKSRFKNFFSITSSLMCLCNKL